MSTSSAKITFSPSRSSATRYNQFCVRFPSFGDPKSVSAVIASTYSRLDYNPGQMAADFIAAMSPRVSVTLVPLTSESMETYNYRVSGDRIDVSKLSRIGGTLFSGTIQKFIDWANKNTGLEHLVKKTVSFTYDGGSRPGRVRTVRVENVSSSEAGELYVEGYDLDEDELKTAFKKFAKGKIDGEINLLN